MRATSGALVALVLTAALAGCSPPPPPPPPTVVNLTLTATPDANPSETGQGAPVAIRVYQLASTSAFSGAEFFQLFNQDQATLGADLVKRDDLIVAPGATKTLSLTPLDTVKAIGVYAAYRDYAGATWRAMTPVVPHKTTEVTVTAGRAGITLVAKPASGP
ncbi:MAG: type VI secretion system lipoprotein TssJ [Proteobacteria bacterium]|nr:type VI secretion system lipoprotein TssJ [Pseudomonadota bacterium]